MPPAALDDHRRVANGFDRPPGYRESGHGHHPRRGWASVPDMSTTTPSDHEKELADIQLTVDTAIEGLNAVYRKSEELGERVQALQNKLEVQDSLLESCYYMLDMICTHLGLPKDDPKPAWRDTTTRDQP